MAGAAPLVAVCLGICVGSAGPGTPRDGDRRVAFRRSLLAAAILLASPSALAWLCVTSSLWGPTSPIDLLLLAGCGAGLGWLVRRLSPSAPERTHRPTRWALPALGGAVAAMLAAPQYAFLGACALPLSAWLVQRGGPQEQGSRAAAGEPGALLVHLLAAAALASSWSLMTMLVGPSPHGIARLAGLAFLGWGLGRIACLGEAVSGGRSRLHVLLIIASVALIGGCLGIVPGVDAALSPQGRGAFLLRLDPIAIELILLGLAGVPAGLAAGSAGVRVGRRQALLACALGLFVALLGARLPPDTYLRLASAGCALYALHLAWGLPGLRARLLVGSALVTTLTAVAAPPPAAVQWPQCWSRNPPRLPRRHRPSA